MYKTVGASALLYGSESWCSLKAGKPLAGRDSSGGAMVYKERRSKERKIRSSCRYEVCKVNWNNTGDDG